MDHWGHDYDYEYHSEHLSEPTFWSIRKGQGIKAALNFWAERKCVKAFTDCHRDAKKHGKNLIRKDYKFPWWFKLCSKIEWWTR